MFIHTPSKNLNDDLPLWDVKDKDPIAKVIVDTLGGWRKKSVKGSNWLDLNKDTYFKEIFLDSETNVAILSGFPTHPPEPNPLIPVDHMAVARDEINQKAGSRRMICHGLMPPNMSNYQDEARRQVEKLKVDSWKMYTGDGMAGKRGWWMDDEKVAYLFYKFTQEFCGIATFIILTHPIPL